MNFRVVHQPDLPTRAEPVPHRRAGQGREVVWVNRFLDRECVRCVAETTLRSYAYDLLHFLRWWVASTKPIPSPRGHLRNPRCWTTSASRPASNRRPAAASINRRVAYGRSCFAREFPERSQSSSRRAFSTGTGGDRRWASAGLARR